MREPKQRMIYSNYTLWENYPDDVLKEMALELGWVDEDDEITEQMLEDWRYGEDEADWDACKVELEDYFDGKTVGFFGTVGLWHGTYRGGKIGEFWDLFYSAMKDCDYLSIYDENGHMYLSCSHHDGNNFFEIKEITDKGKKYLENWEYNWDDNRTEEYVHTQIFDRYSRLPNFAHRVYGCPKREYEKEIA